MSNSPYKTVREALDAADAALKEAEKIAIANNDSFYWDGPSYGMGGYFYPGTSTDSWGDTREDYWQSSSSSC